MANMAAKVTAEYFDSKGLKYHLVGDEQEAMVFSLPMDNADSIRIQVIFSDDLSDASIRAEGIAKCPEERKQKLYELCNELNDSYRWVKFVVSKNNTIDAYDDAVIQLDTCGDEILRCSLQIRAICDKAYPEIMKAIFG